MEHYHNTRQWRIQDLKKGGGGVGGFVGMPRIFSGVFRRILGPAHASCVFSLMPDHNHDNSILMLCSDLSAWRITYSF